MKYTSSLLQQRSCLRLDYQILLKPPSLNLLVRSAPALHCTCEQYSNVFLLGKKIRIYVFGKKDISP